MYNEEMKKLGMNGSAIRELFEYGKIRKKEIGEDNVFDFSIGNPSVPAPSIVNESLIKILTEMDSVKLHGYSSAIGDYSVRCEIAEYLNKTYRCNEVPELIQLTVGAASCLVATFKALFNPGDELIVNAPFWPEYQTLFSNTQGKMVIVPTDDNFNLDLNKIKETINEKTKAIIINSPNNPTGVLYKEETIKELANILNEANKKYNKKIFLISDEAYRELLYTDDDYPFVTNFYDNSIVCYSFSKSISLPGERIGYVLVSNKCSIKSDIYNAIKGASRMLGNVCAPTLFQFLVPHCLGYTSDLAIYNKNRNMLYEMLTNIGYEVVYPDGAFYLFVKSLEKDAKAFSDNAKKYELLLVASDSFGCEGYVRISYCVKTDMIEKSKQAFVKLYNDYHGDKNE